jgi:putative membrane protein
MVKMIKASVWIGGLLAAGLVTAAGAQAPTRTPIPPNAKDFAQDAAQSNQYEIEAAWVARTQSQTPSVRAFADQMIEDHTRAQASIRQAATESGLPPPPPAMSSDQASLLAALQSLRGADFDKLYARQQVLAHSQALAVERSYASEGTDGALRKAARSDVPMIQHHLDMAMKLAAALGTS